MWARPPDAVQRQRPCMSWGAAAAFDLCDLDGKALHSLTDEFEMLEEVTKMMLCANKQAAMAGVDGRQWKGTRRV